MKNSPLVIRLPSDEKQAMLAAKEQGVGSTFHHPSRTIHSHMRNDGFGSRAAVAHSGKRDSVLKVQQKV